MNGLRKILTFLNLSSWQEKLLKFYEENPKFILPKSQEKMKLLQFVKKGLKDLSVSRTSFSWGIPVPKNSKHVIYVWLDALTNYLSAVNFPNVDDKKYKTYWPADVHVIGKDILRFHAIYWPAFFNGCKNSFAYKEFMDTDGYFLMKKKCLNL